MDRKGSFFQKFLGENFMHATLMIDDDLFGDLIHE